MISNSDTESFVSNVHVPIQARVFLIAIEINTPMKNRLLQTFIFLMSTCLNVAAQKNVIAITYQLTSYGGHESEQVLKLLDGKSHFAYSKKDEKLQNAEGMEFYHYFAEIDTYTDARAQEVVRTRLYKRKYLITSSWPFQSFEWKITNETKNILGYSAQKATAKVFYEQNEDIDSPDVIAWFTTDIPYSVGPAGYYGLPGLILELKYSHIAEHYLVKSIDLSGTGKPFIIPTEGFKITKDQMVFPVKNPINEKELKTFYK